MVRIIILNRKVLKVYFALFVGESKRCLENLGGLDELL